MNELHPDRMYDTPELSQLINRSTWALIADRKYGRGIPFVRLGHLVRYRASDVAAYLDAHRVVPGEKKNPAVKPAPGVVQDTRSLPPHLRGARGFH